MQSFCATLDTALAGVESADTLFVFTADHGQVAGNKHDTIYINERWPDLADCLAISPTGHTIWPNGSPRDMFLHLKPDRRETVCASLTRRLHGIAEVMPIEAAIAAGLFGPGPVSAEVRARLGDVLVLPFAPHFVWWREPGIIDNPFHGHHGGLAADELITVFGVTTTL